MAITDKKISEVYSGRDISSLSDTPSKDGMSASELKARFDQLNKEVIPNYNDLIDELDDIITGIDAEKMDVNGGNSTITDLSFVTSGTATPSLGHVVYNADARTWQFGLPNGVVGDAFSESFYPPCKNVDSVQINDGDFVMFYGADGASGVLTVKRAGVTLANPYIGMGIATENIAVSGIGKITWFGLVRGVQSNGANYGESWVDGDVLYNSGTITGGLSKVKPIAPKPAIIVASVVKSHSSNGILMVRPSFLPTLASLSDVYTNAIANGDALLWNSSTARFENIAIYSKAQTDSLFVANSLADRARANHTGTQSADTLTDGSTNKAFLATERTKLAGIEAGAEVNNMSDTNAIDLTDGGETSLHKHDSMYYTKALLDAGQLDTRYYTETEITTNYYTKTDIDNKVASMYKYKGSVADYAHLPSSGNIAGDVWNTLDTGQNYAWTGSAWDDIGGTEILASDDDNGLMSKEDFTRLKDVEAGAEVNQNAFSIITSSDETLETFTASSKEDTFKIKAGLNVSLTKTVNNELLISTSGDIAVEANNVSFVPYGNITGDNVQEALEDVSDLQDTTLFVTDEEIGEFSANWDADTLESHPATYFATADHNHTGLYATVNDLDLKAPLASPTFTGTATAPTINATSSLQINGSSVQEQLNTKQLKNWIINGGFDVWQRGTSQTSSGYGSDDRFTNGHGGSTKTHSRQAFTLGQTEVPNNPTYYSRTIVSSVAGAGNYVFKIQRIEDVTKLAGKTISISFWAKADSSKNLSISLGQNFGLGGSTTIDTIGVQKFSLTTSWQRFTKTISIPSVNGKTIVSGNNLYLAFWFDAGSSFNAYTDSLGNQSGTFDIANVSLVEGSVPVEWQTEAYADVLRQCQRYYYKAQATNLYGYYSMGYVENSQTQFYVLYLPTELRATITSVDFNDMWSTRSGVGSFAITAISAKLVASNIVSIQTSVSTSTLSVNQNCVLYSNSLSSYIGFNAEL